MSAIRSDNIRISIKEMMVGDGYRAILGAGYTEGARTVSVDDVFECKTYQEAIDWAIAQLTKAKEPAGATP